MRARSTTIIENRWTSRRGGDNRTPAEHVAGCRGSMTGAGTSVRHGGRKKLKRLGFKFTRKKKISKQSLNSNGAEDESTTQHFQSCSPTPPMREKRDPREQAREKEKKAAGREQEEKALRDLIALRETQLKRAHEMIVECLGRTREAEKKAQVLPSLEFQLLTLRSQLARGRSTNDEVATHVTRSSDDDEDSDIHEMSHFRRSASRLRMTSAARRELNKHERK